MKKLIITAIAAAVVATCGSVYATNASGFFLGLGGGYNNADLPTGSQTFSPLAFPYTVTASKQKFFLNANAGYLFAIGKSGFDVGPQIGYTYYGNYKLSERTVGIATVSGHNKTTIQSINFKLDGRYTIDSFFLGANAGIGDFLLHSSGELSDNSSHVYVPSNGNSWDFMSGASLGYNITKNVSVEATYEHVFGQDIKMNDTNTNKAPTMNMFGGAVTVYF